VIVSGTSTLALSPPDAWAALSDPSRLGEAIPHVDSVDVGSDGAFSAVARPHTSLGASPLRMDFEIADRREGEHVRILGSGTAGENLVQLAVELDLSADGGGTRASWTADVRVRGVLASLLQRSLPALVTDQVNAVLAAASSR
jgi:carbon monoxide dehydrogenase subunit G